MEFAKFHSVAKLKCQEHISTISTQDNNLTAYSILGEWDEAPQSNEAPAHGARRVIGDDQGRDRPGLGAQLNFPLQPNPPSLIRAERGIDPFGKEIQSKIKKD